MISLPRLPLSKVVLGVKSYASGVALTTARLPKFVARRAAFHWREAEITSDTNARAREVLLAGIDKEREAA